MVISEKFSHVSPYLVPILDHTCMLNKIGLCQRAIHVKDFMSGCVTDVKEPTCDRFKISLPYAGVHLNWEVIFNHECIDMPPDFILGNNDAKFQPDICELKSLEKWNSHDPACLINVLTELVEAFKKFHISTIETHSRLECEYNNILSLEEYHFTRDDIEVFAHEKNKEIGTVNFMLKLPVDFSKLPVSLFRKSAGEDSALLLLVIESPDKHVVKPELFLSPRIKNILGPVESLAIPPFPEQGFLTDYIPVVCDLLAKKVNEIVANYELRRDFMNHFLVKYDRCVLEFDGEGFRNVSALMEWRDFYFIITVEIPDTFPSQAPVLTWQSIYHEKRNENTPFVDGNQTFPYSPRWEPAEMVERLRRHILEKVKEFQKKSVTEGRLTSAKSEV